MKTKADKKFKDQAGEGILSSLGAAIFGPPTESRRFRIERATVWNLVTDRGEPCGEAAMFDHWEFL